MLMQSILEVTNLTTSFNTPNGLFKAVDDISFQLQKEEVIGIVGESGSGKSVTSLSIMQLLQGSGNIQGSAFLNKDNGSINLFSLPEEEKRKYRGKDIAMIFQEPMTSLNPVLTCGYQVSEALRLHLNMNKKQAKDKT